MKKRIYIERGDLIINVNKQCFFTVFTEWGQLFGKCNWVTITPIHIFWERDIMCKVYLFQITLLGFSVAFRYNTKEALKLLKQWEKDAKKDAKLILAKTKKVASKKSKSK